MPIAVMLTSLFLMASPAAEEMQEARTSPPAADRAPRSSRGDGTVCRRETVLDSNRTRRVCTTAAQREAARESAQRVFQRIDEGVALPREETQKD